MRERIRKKKLRKRDDNKIKQKNRKLFIKQRYTICVS